MNAETTDHTICELDANSWNGFAALVEATTGSTEAAGASAFTPNADNETSTIEPSRSSVYGPIAPTLRSSSTRNATLELSEQYGFSRVRQVGKHAWIVNRTVDRIDTPFEVSPHERTVGPEHPRGEQSP